MRYAIGIEYDGSGFMGWQRLPHGPTLQEAVEQALGFVADHAVEATCAGRTDAGVHALCQVAHFDSAAQRSERGWVLGCNSRLPPAVVLRRSEEHTSELQSRENLVCRLLLEKK